MPSPLDRHEKVALSFSGGKDSSACVELLRDKLDRIVIYHNDTGDLLPEMVEAVARVEAFAPHFVRVQTNVGAWIAEHGLPSDLMPYAMHNVGQVMGQHSGPRIVSRYDCCYANLMAPMWERMRQDGITLLIRGTKRCDMPKLPVEDGSVTEGIELWLPLLTWSHADVFAFLNAREVPVPRLYQYVTNSPECARCPAWWGERRNSYLKEFHPELWADYQTRLSAVAAHIVPAMAAFMSEWEGMPDHERPA